MIIQKLYFPIYIAVPLIKAAFFLVT